MVKYGYRSKNIVNFIKGWIGEPQGLNYRYGIEQIKSYQILWNVVYSVTIVLCFLPHRIKKYSNYYFSQKKETH